MKTTITDTEARSDVQNPMSHRDVYYRRATMRRKDAFCENPTPSISEIANCQNRTGTLIDLGTHEYRAYKVVQFWSDAQISDYLKEKLVKAIPIESHTVDTGERKTILGYRAKHLVTTINRAHDSSNDGGQETSDGWFIEHEPADLHCAPDSTRRNPFYLFGTTLTQYPEIPKFHHTGPLPTGLAVRLVRTTKQGNSGRVVTLDEAVEELSDSPLNPLLFDLPKGFRENPQLLRSKRNSTNNY